MMRGPTQFQQSVDGCIAGRHHLVVCGWEAASCRSDRVRAGQREQRRCGRSDRAPRPAEVVRSFAHNWDDRRAKMVEKIGTLAKSATGVGEAFEELDKEFAAALRGDK